MTEYAGNFRKESYEREKKNEKTNESKVVIIS